MNLTSRLLLILLGFVVTLRGEIPGILNYQGRVTSGGVPFEGMGRFKFALVDGLGTHTYWSHDGTGANGGEPTSALTIPVIRGLYTVVLGDAHPIGPEVFTNPAVYLRVWFNDGTHGSQLLSPDQRLTPVGSALVAATAAGVSGPVAATQLTGVLPATALPSIVVTNGATGITLSGSFQGDGGSLINLNADRLVSGTVPLFVLPPTLVVNGTSGVFLSGSFQGDGSSLSNLNAGRLTTGSMPLAALPPSVVTNGATGVTLSGSFQGDGSGLVAISPDSLKTDVSSVPFAFGNGTGSIPSPPDGVIGVTAVAAGVFHGLALKGDGNVLAWGNNFDGQTTIPPRLSNVVAIAAGGYHSLAVQRNGIVVGWGRNTDGQINPPFGLTNVIAVSAGFASSLALKADGTVVAWGIDKSGVGAVPSDLRGVKAIAAGGNHYLALKNDGTVVAWGRFYGGPTAVPVGLSNVVMVAAGGSHSVALKGDGTVVAWGNTGLEQRDVPFGLNHVISVSAGLSHVVALKDDGSIVSWGISPVPNTDWNDVVDLAPGPMAEYGLVLRKRLATAVAAVNGNTSISGSFSALSIYADSVSANSFITTSDRNAKEHFRPIDPDEVLQRVLALPLSRWNFKNDTGVTHLGPMAQDFRAAFGLGADDRHIATVDADGVALAAIQGLNQKLVEELKRRDAEIAELKRMVRSLVKEK